MAQSHALDAPTFSTCHSWTRILKCLLDHVAMVICTCCPRIEHLPIKDQRYDKTSSRTKRKTAKLEKASVMSVQFTFFSQWLVAHEGQEQPLLTQDAVVARLGGDKTDMQGNSQCRSSGMTSCCPIGSRAICSIASKWG